MNIERVLKMVRGRWFLVFGFCPLCDSSAPELYDCPVCEYNHVPKKYWRQRFISYLYGEPMPTFRYKQSKKS